MKEPKTIYLISNGFAAYCLRRICGEKSEVCFMDGAWVVSGSSAKDILDSVGISRKKITLAKAKKLFPQAFK